MPISLRAGSKVGGVTYDAVYSGDATGATDVTTDLTTWIEAQSSKTVALATNGIYKVSRQSNDVACRINNVNGMRLDFRGARIVMDALPTLRSGSDLSATNHSTTVTSASANFTSADASEERVIVIDGVSYAIVGVTNSTTASIRYTSYSGALNFYQGTTGSGKGWVIRAHRPHGITRWEGCNNITLNDPWVVGSNTGFEWVDPDQYEHGITILAGNGAANDSNFTINRPIMSDTGGDGIECNGEVNGTFRKPVVAITDASITRAGRNGMSLDAGVVTVNGGSISHCGLHGIDFEPNDSDQGASIVAEIRGITISTFDDLPVETGACAIAGATGFQKQTLTVNNVTADVLTIRTDNWDATTVTNNTSTNDSRTTGSGYTAESAVFWQNVTSRTFTGNSANMNQVNGAP